MKDKLRTILYAYGKDKQMLQAVEEMSELTKELIKNANRGSNNSNEIIEEIVDVEIMLDQLKIIFMVDDSMLKKYRDSKIDRQIKRIEGGE